MRYLKNRNSFFLFRIKMNPYRSRIIAGIDEAGRWCLAGPVVANEKIIDTYIFFGYKGNSVSITR